MCLVLPFYLIGYVTVYTPFFNHTKQKYEYSNFKEITELQFI
jgi:hypothetical protein